MPKIVAKPPAVFLMGPTASGKTDLAMHLVQRFPLEIISVDSAQVYRSLDIGTAKPSPEILAQVPHHLIDIRDPTASYSAAEFRSDALATMAQISANGRVPLLVGGTGLYFRALRYGLSELPPADPVLRAQLELETMQRGLGAMHADLVRVDPIAAARIHPHDAQRILRALEVWYLTGYTLSSQQHGPQAAALPYRVLVLALVPRVRETLRLRIAARFQNMLTQGLEHEVRSLLKHWPLVPNTPALRCVGYRQVVRYLLGEWSREEMIERGITATCGLAKRQLTWLRTESDVNWLYAEDGDVTTAACAYLAQWQIK